jgi:hypothetical protein
MFSSTVINFRYYFIYGGFDCRDLFFIIYLFTAIGFAPGGSGPYTTQLQQKTYNINNKKHTTLVRLLSVLLL